MRFSNISQELIASARGGSAQAMEELCLAVQPGAYAVLLSVLRDADDAADALQESLVRMVRHLASLRVIEKFPGWLMRILVNQATSLQKRPAANIIDLALIDEVQQQSSTPLSGGDNPSPREVAAQTQMLGIINEAIRQLPARQKTAMVLFEMERLPIREVAQIMELTDGAVKFHLHEGRKNLRKHLIELGISPHDLAREEGSVC